MYSRRFKTGYFILDGLNSAATVYYLYYFYFYMEKVHGFGNKSNLCLAALNGGTYALLAWVGGRFAQRFGYFNALKIGFAVMAAALGAGSQLHFATGQVLVTMAVMAGMSFTWPALEALVSEGEPRAGLQHMVGKYNAIWAGCGAVASFAGGAMLERLGMRSLFYVPMSLLLAELAITLWLEHRARRMQNHGASLRASRVDSEAAIVPLPAAAARSQRFLRMAWLANPFAYIAMNTMIALMPGIARHLQLSTMLAGFWGSLWCFARLASFVALWQWSGWHYRFRWLLGAYLGLIAAFVAILLAPSLTVLVAGQIVFGGAVGLIYYSSLFYSMDSSDTKGEHGGIHESVIGLGNCAGPAVGAAALQFLPQYSHSGALAVGVLLVCGLCGLTAIWWPGKSL